jgi:cytochrome b6-f complex iron-sulfur subunit
VSPGTVALLLVAGGILAFALFMLNVTIRRQRQAKADAGRAGTGPPSTDVEPKPSVRPQPASAGKTDVTVETVPKQQRKPLTREQMAISRRQFLNRSWTASFTAFLGFFGMGSLSFLWPKLTGGFGTRINAGNYDDILSQVGPENGFKPLFIPEGRFYLVYYEGTGDSPVYAATGAAEVKLQALYRKCVHLGCSVPHCETSMLFECPCHGSKYQLTGEYFQGPAPRGLDRFPVAVEGAAVMVDTGSVQTGPPRGTSTWERFAEPTGAYCVPV